MSSDKPRFSLRDKLTMTTDEGKIELAEQELSRVNGGYSNKWADKLSPTIPKQSFSA